MRKQDLKHRTRGFALDVIKVVEKLPRDTISQVLGKQLLRSGTSVAANYRSATRAKSPADFIAKMGIIEEEADESALWADLLTASSRLSSETAEPILREANELTAIAVASIRTARQAAAQNSPAGRGTVTRRSAFRAPRSP